MLNVCVQCAASISDHLVQEKIYDGPFHTEPRVVFFCSDACRNAHLGVMTLRCEGCERHLLLGAGWKHLGYFAPGTGRQCTMCYERAVLSQGQSRARLFSANRDEPITSVNDVWSMFGGFVDAWGYQSPLLPVTPLSVAGGALSRWMNAEYRCEKRFKLKWRSKMTHKVFFEQQLLPFTAYLLDVVRNPLYDKWFLAKEAVGRFHKTVLLFVHQRTFVVEARNAALAFLCAIKATNKHKPMFARFPVDVARLVARKVFESFRDPVWLEVQTTLLNAQ